MGHLWLGISGLLRSYLVCIRRDWLGVDRGPGRQMAHSAAARARMAAFAAMSMPAPYGQR
ncbi:hypothetical protein GCM10011610_26150 [Nocardia rhizosphaerihabitans]|uniref:Uncharacterized protein n=1 Tax=Nocardia rhizosphaerihabitans TaxID=1691570 RepID=A0ABQ2KEH9_9NOCA|nr:hypothetical protein GCM10011610_26150 [Nocardia rhizosphaerihabitans]